MKNILSVLVMTVIVSIGLQAKNNRQEELSNTSNSTENNEPVKVTAEGTWITTIIKGGSTGYIQSSVDAGKTWNTVWDGEMDAMTRASKLYDITYADGTLVAVGQIILVSKDKGKTWKEITLYQYNGSNAFGRNNLKTITYGGGYFVAACANHIIYSKDGENWKFVRTDKLSTAEKYAKENPSGLSLEDIKKDPKLHGKRPSIGEFAPEITPGIKVAHDIIFAKDRFLVSGGNGAMEGLMLKIEGNKVVKIKDLTFTGNAATLNTGGLKKLAYDGGSTILAVSNSTKSAYSTDLGENWRYMFNPDKNQGWVACYNNGKWFSASPFGDLFYSDDITTKWAGSKKAWSTAPITDMIYTGNQYVVVGNDSVVFTSSDGENWNMVSKKNFGMHMQSIVVVK